MIHPVYLYVLFSRSSGIDNFRIAEPFPENIFPMEYTSAEITCVAFDSSGEKTPERIQFMRKDHFAAYTNITANDNLSFEEKLEDVNGHRK